MAVSSLRVRNCIRFGCFNSGRLHSLLVSSLSSIVCLAFIFVIARSLLLAKNLVEPALKEIATLSEIVAIIIGID